MMVLCVCADTDRSPCEARIYIQPPQALPHNHLSVPSTRLWLQSVPVPSDLGLLVAVALVVVSSSVKREHAVGSAIKFNQELNYVCDQFRQ